MKYFSNRKAQLVANSKSVFISYSHESPEHKVWVYSLALELRKNGFDVVMDVDENPRPEKPKNGDDWKKKLDYQAGELAENYLWELHGPISNLGSVAIRPSPQLPMKLSPEWNDYLDSIYSVISLIGCCKNIIIVNTPNYVHNSSPPIGSSKAGWVFEEFQYLLNCLRKGEDKNVVSIFRAGEKAIEGCKWARFQVIDFSSMNMSYYDSFNLLLSALNK